MKVLYFKAIVIVFGLMVSTSCKVSFQSNQYSFMRELFQSKETVPKKSWNVNWGSRSYAVYAINHSEGIFFANEEGLIVSFDGWQITDIRLPGMKGQKEVVASSDESNDGSVTLRFIDGNGSESDPHVCAVWQRSVARENSSGWIQRCLSGDGEYQNSISLNGAGHLTALSFIVEPNAPPMVLELAVQ